MAKKKLTTEEKLQAALVPEEEQPYKVPENWCWTHINVFFDVTSSKRVHKEDWLTDGIPFIRTRELVKLSENGTVDNELFISQELYEKNKNEYGVPKIGDILISGVGTIGVPYIVKGIKPFYFKDGNVLWFQNKGINADYIYWLYKTDYMYNLIHDMSAGTTVDTYTIVNAKKTRIPIAPSNEQSRIVARIESLFAKLDEAKEKIQEVLDGAELRKAAILHQAFTGKLTEKWRKENGVSEDSRERCSVKSVCNSLKYGTAKKSDPNGEVVVLRMGNLQAGEIDWGSLVYSNDQEDIKKYKLTAGDVLFNRTNSAELVGKTSIYRGERPAIYAGYLIKLDYKHDKIIGEYLNYMLNSPAAKRYCNRVKTDGVNQSNINAQKIGAFEFVVPLISEQKEIVRLLDNMLTREKATQSACESALDTIDTLKKSILARAFRGELGTNDPSEASAKELLKEILA